MSLSDTGSIWMGTRAYSGGDSGAVNTAENAPAWGVGRLMGWWVLVVGPAPPKKEASCSVYCRLFGLL